MDSHASAPSARPTSSRAASTYRQAAVHHRHLAEAQTSRLYIQTGRRKDVSKQIRANDRIEICAFDGQKWLRIAACAVEDDRRQARKSMLDAYPELRKMYDEDDGNTQVLYLADATATLSSFTEPPQTLSF